MDKQISWQIGWLALLIGLILAACGQQAPTARPGGGGALDQAPPVSQQPVTPTVNPTPTIIPSPTPTEIPSPTPADLPSPTPSIPSLHVNGTSARPCTRVWISGYHYPADRPITVRLGLPGPSGPVLASAIPDVSGTWLTTLFLPPALPEGGDLPSEFNLVTEDEQGRILNSEPLAIFRASEEEPQGLTLATAELMMRDTLSAWVAGCDIRPYLSASLRQEVTSGKLPSAVLGLRPAPRWTLAPLPLQPQATLTVQALLQYPDLSELRTFTLVPEEGLWQIAASSSEPIGPAGIPIKYLWPQQIPAGLSLNIDRQLSSAATGSWQLNFTTNADGMFLFGGVSSINLLSAGTPADYGTVRGQAAAIYEVFGVTQVIWNEGNQIYSVAVTRGTVSAAELLAIANSLEEVERAEWERRIQQ